MEHRYFLKLALGLAMGVTAIAASANAVPLPPMSAAPGFASMPREQVEPAVVTQSEVDHLKPEQVHWHHHHWHHHHWHHHHWHHHHWHRHR